eukprot:m.127444 g.127444  ORF g.127444 m.127444 type:complete len:192 (-) comp22231_c0_seq2:41-616(-)
MWALYILSWVSSLLLACFGIVCIASGLYFLAETVEEYSVATKQLLNFAVVACTFCNLLVGLVEPIPIWVTVVAVVAHGAYLNTLQTFPVLETGPSFYASCLLILLHNYLAFTTFADTWFPFDEFLAYFVICVWLVPFGLFVSLSVNDNVLPTHGGPASSSSNGQPHGSKGNRSGLLVAFDSVRNIASDVIG